MLVPPKHVVPATNCLAYWHVRNVEIIKKKQHILNKGPYHRKIPGVRASSSRLLASDLPVSSALSYVHQLFYPPRVSQGFGVLHVFAGDLVQGTADGCHGLIRQHAGASASRKPVDQVSHGVFTCQMQKISFYFQKVLGFCYYKTVTVQSLKNKSSKETIIGKKKTMAKNKMTNITTVRGKVTFITPEGSVYKTSL